MDWDQPLRDELLLKWKATGIQLQESQSYALPRCYLDGTTDGQVISCQLYGFCYASCKAYAAVVYLLLETLAG